MQKINSITTVPAEIQGTHSIWILFFRISPIISKRMTMHMHVTKITGKGLYHSDSRILNCHMLAAALVAPHVKQYIPVISNNAHDHSFSPPLLTRWQTRDASISSRILDDRYHIPALRSLRSDKEIIDSGGIHRDQNKTKS